MDRIPVTMITAREYSKDNHQSQHQRVPVERQLAEIRHPGKETLVQRADERALARPNPRLLHDTALALFDLDFIQVFFRFGEFHV